METIDITVDALILADWHGQLQQADDGGWLATFVCELVPYEGGVRIMGTAFQQLALLGLVTRYETIVAYPAGPAPATVDVGTAQMQWALAVHGAAAAQWVGKRATAFVMNLPLAEVKR